MCIKTLKCLCAPHEDIKSGGIVPLILNLSSRRRYVVSYTPQPLHFLYTLNRKLGGLRSGKDTLEKKSPFNLAGIEPQHQVPTELMYAFCNCSINVYGVFSTLN
jgi:hypothetical protein